MFATFVRVNVTFGKQNRHEFFTFIFLFFFIFRFKKSDGTMKGRMHCPKITLDGDYELSGRVLLLPVRGKGRSVIVLGKSLKYRNNTRKKK